MWGIVWNVKDVIIGHYNLKKSLLVQVINYFKYNDIKLNFLIVLFNIICTEMILIFYMRFTIKILRQNTVQKKKACTSSLVLTILTVHFKIKDFT